MQKICHILLGATFSTMILFIFSVPIWIVFLTALTVLIIIEMLSLIHRNKPKGIHTLEVNRKISQNENLSGEIIYETPFNYLVQFTTFSDGKWEELIPKGSEEIVAIYDVQLIPMKPTIHGF